MTGQPQPPRPIPAGLCTVAELARWLNRPPAQLYKKIDRAAARGETLPEHETDPHTGRRKFDPEPFHAWLLSQPGPGNPALKTSHPAQGQ
ncbi:hypothetical protein AB0D67_36720 [Streptosporangium sp. NPDC048047]|uniref:hypothetical protein n=1 Tax=Streptosporangium sp. NPDC048047 TaxID=3155748 RepID=UPI0034373BAF